MPSQDVKHESLQLPGYWRITSFGRLAENPLSAGPDLRIRTYLAPLASSSDSLLRDGKIAGPLQSMLLPIGEIPRLHLNAVLHNGKLASHLVPKLSLEHDFNRHLNCARDNITVLERFARDRYDQHIIPVRKDWLARINDPEMNGLFIAIGSDIDPYATIIPAIEIFRFFYATSDVLAKALFRDDFLDPETNLWNPEKTAMRADGKAVIWLRKKMLDADARFLARFAFDSYALQQAQQIFLYAAALGTTQGTRMVRALPPFEDTVATKFLGCPIGGPNGDRVLVTRLQQCHWKPPFIELKWDRDNDGRYDPDRRSERPPTDWSPNFLYAPDRENQEPESLATSAPSTANIPSRLQVSEISERFPELGATPADKLPQENSETRAAERDWRPIVGEAYEGSVVEGQSSRDLVGKTIIEGLEKKPASQKQQTDAVDITIGQADYLVVLELLHAIRNFALAKIDFMSVLKSAKTAFGVQFNVYPKELDARKKAWLYVDEDKKNCRMALVAQINRDGKKRYVIELQQRRPGEASTLVVWNEPERSIPPGLLGHLLMDCAKAGSARLDSAAMLGVKWGRLHHTTKESDEKSAAHFLSRIFDEVKPVQPAKNK